MSGGGGVKVRKKIFASVELKRAAMLEEQSKKKNRQDAKQQKVADKSGALTKRIANGSGFACPMAGCTRILLGQHKLGLHLMRNECSRGSNPFRKGRCPPAEYSSYQDRRRKLIQRINGEHVTNVHSRDARSGALEDAKLADSGEYTLLTGGPYMVEVVCRGFACKARKRSNRVYTARQLDFISWCFFEGVKGDHGGDPAKKYSADRATDEMRAYGTSGGAALHPRAEYW